DHGLRFREVLGRGTELDWGEEAYLFFTLLGKGGRIAYVPGAVVRHEDLSSRDRERFIVHARRHSAAYLTMLLVEQPDFRGRTARYPARVTSKQRPPCRPAGDPRPASRLKLAVAGCRGPLIYLRSRMGRR